MTPHQSGNRKYHSTETLNLLVGDTILENMNNTFLTALILLGLSKALDSISHSILLEKLAHVDTSPGALKWFKSYLTGRSQRVRIGSTVTSQLLITHGVPQGAILSPLLFCIYLNDLPSSPLSWQLESYVDDSKVLLPFKVKDLAKQNLEEDLNCVAKWCCHNQLLINPKKTKFLLIGTHQMLQKLPPDISLSFSWESLLHQFQQPKIWDYSSTLI